MKLIFFFFNFCFWPFKSWSIQYSINLIFNDRVIRYGLRFFFPKVLSCISFYWWRGLDVCRLWSFALIVHSNWCYDEDEAVSFGIGNLTIMIDSSEKSLFISVYMCVSLYVRLSYYCERCGKLIENILIGDNIFWSLTEFENNER